MEFRTIFKRQKPQQSILPEPDFTDNWKYEQYEKNVLEGIEHLRKGKTIKIYDDGRGYELACDIKRRFILEYQKQLAEKIKINEFREVITLSVENINYEQIR
jgi:hypothetical protein